jgi:hypothetical protein
MKIGIGKVDWIRILLIITIITMLGYFAILEIKPTTAANAIPLYSLYFSALTLIALLLTLNIYKGLLEVSERTLSFTQNQSSFSSYLDNFKLFYELSKQKTDILSQGDLQSDARSFFENLTFNTIHLNYINILMNFPDFEVFPKYDNTFKRFNNKIKAFINIIYEELLRIKEDKNLNNEQKLNLLELYKGFVLSDYINLSRDLLDNIQKQKDNIKDLRDLVNRGDLLKCNKPGNLVFDVDSFLVLYFEVIK